MRSCIISSGRAVLAVRAETITGMLYSFKDNGVRSQSSFTNPGPTHDQHARSPGRLAVTDPHPLPSPPAHPPKQGTAGKGGWRGHKKSVSPSNTQGHSKANTVTMTTKKACYCGGFASPTSYTRGGYVSRPVASSLLFVTSVCKAIQGLSTK